MRGYMVVSKPQARISSSPPHRRERESSNVPRWVLDCPLCKVEFTHSEIDPEYRSPLLDPFARFGDKPELPSAGVNLECPNCREVSVYKRYQLTYRDS